MSEKNIIGISAGRKDRVTERAIKTILEASGLAYQFYSLSNFEILTCDACNSCIESHRCIKDDKLNQILKEMKEASGIIFGAPEYWEGMNAKGRAFWERVCFSTRHNKHFPLDGKLGVVIGVSGDGDSSAVITDITNFYTDARIEITTKVEIQGEYACFSCGYGDECSVGGLAEIYDLPLNIKDDKIPGLDNQHPEKISKGGNIVIRLKEIGRRLTQRLEGTY
ncbi:NADPH-dependent FMN reductase [Halobacteroides halobius DSM 5150]|uniref:NADPH-dependent FMN reductase n=1 Tax=Halobacteroides halobius (strain ATCC 35273 / DSM 5150 / MD-1) TaxID=748449 RepID=L0KAI4_HALHC|nr:flavodoxin family protein [Halobacteroides halobius]AGB42026.1 NADPH-dependent FMN reductase [Halobacteroides halobius DSM 5150]